MTREDIIRMAREAGFLEYLLRVYRAEEGVHHFAALVAAAERNKLAQWMIDRGYATGHGDTIEDLLEELDWQITESWSKVVMASVKAEREACAKLCADGINAPQYPMLSEIAAAIRARGEK